MELAAMYDASLATSFEDDLIVVDLTQATSPHFSIYSIS